MIEYLHESIVDGNHENLALLFSLFIGEVARNMRVRAARRESSWDTNDETFARGQFFGEVDSVARTIFPEL